MDDLHFILIEFLSPHPLQLPITATFPPASLLTSLDPPLSVLKIGFNGIFTWRMSFVDAKKTS